MWDKQKQEYFDALRIKEVQGRLTDTEKRELSAMFAELEAEEADTLKESIEKFDSSIKELKAEKERIKNKNETLTVREK